jgi:small-conductance mechanosensitive channel
MLVPMSYFIEKTFENWSHESDSLRSSFIFYVDYLMPIEPLRAEFNRVLEKSPLWDGKASRLYVSNITEHAVEVRIQLSAANADNLSDLRAVVREKLLEFLRNHYPHCLPMLRVDAERNNNNGGSTPHETGTS